MFATAQLENLEITSFRFRRAIFQQQQKKTEIDLTIRCNIS